MDKTTRLLLGLADKNLAFGEEWLEYRQIESIQAQIIKAALA